MRWDIVSPLGYPKIVTECLSAASLLTLDLVRSNLGLLTGLSRQFGGNPALVFILKPQLASME